MSFPGFMTLHEDDSDSEDEVHYDDSAHRKQLEHERTANDKIYKRESMKRKSIGPDGLRKDSCIKRESIYEPFEEDKLAALMGEELNKKSKARRKRKKKEKKVKKVTFTELNTMRTNDVGGYFPDYVEVYTKMGTELYEMPHIVEKVETLEKLMVGRRNAREKERALSLWEILLAGGQDDSEDDEEDDDEEEEDDLDKVSVFQQFISDDDDSDREEEDDSEAEEERNQEENENLIRKMHAAEESKNRYIRNENDLIENYFKVLLEAAEDAAKQDTQELRRVINHDIAKLNAPLRRIISHKAFEPLFKRYTHLDSIVTQISTKPFSLKKKFGKFVYSPIISEETPNYKEHWENLVRRGVSEVLKIMDKLSELVNDIEGINGLGAMTKNERDLPSGKILLRKDTTRKYFDFMTKKWHLETEDDFDIDDHVLIHSSYEPTAINYGPGKRDHWVKKFQRWQKFGNFFVNPLFMWRKTQESFAKVYFSLHSVGIGAAMINSNKILLKYFNSYHITPIMQTLHSKLFVQKIKNNVSVNDKRVKLPEVNTLKYDKNPENTHESVWGSNTILHAYAITTRSINGNLSPVERADSYFSRRRTDSACFHGCLGHHGKLLNMMIRLGKKDMVEFALDNGLSCNLVTCSWVPRSLKWDRRKTADVSSIRKGKTTDEADLETEDDTSGLVDELADKRRSKAENEEETEDEGSSDEVQQKKETPQKKLRRGSASLSKASKERKAADKKYKGEFPPSKDCIGFEDDDAIHSKTVFEPTNPLAVAVECAIARGGEMEIVQVLLNRGADPLRYDGIGLRSCIPVIDAWARKGEYLQPKTSVLRFDRDDAVVLDSVVRQARKVLSRGSIQKAFEGNYASIVVKNHMVFEALRQGYWDAVRFLAQINPKIGASQSVVPSEELNLPPTVAVVFDAVIEKALSLALEEGSNFRSQMLNGVWFLIEEFKFYPTDSQLFRLYQAMVESMASGPMSERAGDRKAITRLFNNSQMRHFLQIEEDDEWESKRLSQFMFGAKPKGEGQGKLGVLSQLTRRLSTSSFLSSKSSSKIASSRNLTARDLPTRKISNLSSRNLANLSSRKLSTRNLAIQGDKTPLSESPQNMKRKLFIMAARSGHAHILDILEDAVDLKKKHVEEALRNVTQYYFQFHLYDRISKLYIEKTSEPIFAAFMSVILQKNLIASLDRAFSNNEILAILNRIQNGDGDRDSFQNFFSNEIAAFGLYELLKRDVLPGKSEREMKGYNHFIYDTIFFGPFYDEDYLRDNPALRLSRVFAFDIIVDFYVKHARKEKIITLIQRLDGDFYSWDEGMNYLITKAIEVHKEFGKAGHEVSGVHENTRKASIQFDDPFIQLLEPPPTKIMSMKLEDDVQDLFDKYGPSGRDPHMSEML